MAVVEFKEYALVWWVQHQQKLQSVQLPVPETWQELIRAMEVRFVLRNYRLELIQKIHALTQGSQTVEEYRAEMEMLMLRANYQDEDNGTMFRFFQGLR